MDYEGTIYPYIGGGFMTPGFSMAVTWGPSEPTPGLNVAGTLAPYGAYQRGYAWGKDGSGGWYSEAGGAYPPSASLTAFWVWEWQVPWQ